LTHAYGTFQIKRASPHNDLKAVTELLRNISQSMISDEICVNENIFYECICHIKQKKNIYGIMGLQWCLRHYWSLNVSGKKTNNMLYLPCITI